MLPELSIPYKYGDRPFSTLSLMYGIELERPTDCRGAVQLFYYQIFGIVLPPIDVLSAESYRNWGTTVCEGNDPGFFSKLTFGDVIYSDAMYTNRLHLGLSREELLHLAVYLGNSKDLRVRQFFPETKYSGDKPLIYHATAIAGKSVVWDTEEFVRYYKIVRAKRITM